MDVVPADETSSSTGFVTWSELWMMLRAGAKPLKGRFDWI